MRHDPTTEDIADTIGVRRHGHDAQGRVAVVWKTIVSHNHPSDV
jgi:hypothetical protein